MIRLTELSCTNRQAVVKLEGYLTQDAVTVLSDILAEYASRNVLQVHLNANGLVTLDRVAVSRWRLTLPSEPELKFHTSRKTLQSQLQSCGLAVVFDDPD